MDLQNLQSKHNFQSTLEVPGDKNNAYCSSQAGRDDHPRPPSSTGSHRTGPLGSSSRQKLTADNGKEEVVVTDVASAATMDFRKSLLNTRDLEYR